MYRCLTRAILLVSLCFTACDRPLKEAPVPLARVGSRVLGEFEVQIDPAAGAMTWARGNTARGLSVLPDVRDGLTGTNPADTFELVDNAPAQPCTAAMFCKDIRLTSFFDKPFDNVFVEFTSINPPTNILLDGLTAADAADFENLPTTFGVYSYGSIDAFDSAIRPWKFAAGGTNFTVRGVVKGTVCGDGTCDPPEQLSCPDDCYDRYPLSEVFFCGPDALTGDNIDVCAENPDWLDEPTDDEVEEEAETVEEATYNFVQVTVPEPPLEVDVFYPIAVAASIDDADGDLYALGANLDLLFTTAQNTSGFAIDEEDLFDEGATHDLDPMGTAAATTNTLIAAIAPTTRSALAALAPDPVGTQADGSVITRYPSGELQEVTDAGGRTKRFWRDGSITDIEMPAAPGKKRDVYSIVRDPDGTYRLDLLRAEDTVASFEARGGTKQVDAYGNVTYVFKNNRSRTWSTNGGTIERDPSNRITIIRYVDGSSFDIRYDGLSTLVTNWRFDSNKPGAAAGVWWTRVDPYAYLPTRVGTWLPEGGQRQSASFDLRQADGTIRIRDKNRDEIRTSAGKVIAATAKVQPDGASVFSAGSVIYSIEHPNRRTILINRDSDDAVINIDILQHSQDVLVAATIQRSGTTYDLKDGPIAMTGSFDVEATGRLWFQDEQTRNWIGYNSNGSTLNVTTRPASLIHPGGRRLDFLYGANGALSGIKKTDTDKSVYYWRKLSAGWGTGPTWADAESLERFPGTMTVDANGEVSTKEKRELGTWRSDGYTVIEDTVTQSFRWIDETGELRHIQGNRGDTWSFGQDDRQRRTFRQPDRVLWTLTNVSGNVETWEDGKGNSFKGSVVPGIYRFVITKLDSFNRRTITETRYANGAQEVFTPDDPASNDQVVWSAFIEEQPVLPVGTTFGQFYQAYRFGMGVRVKELFAELGMYRRVYLRISLSRGDHNKDVTFQELTMMATIIEDQIRTLQGYLDNNRLWFFDNYWKNVFPPSQKDSAVLKPFAELGAKMDTYKRERPSAGQLFLAAWNSAIAKVGDLAEAAIDHPVLATVMFVGAIACPAYTLPLLAIAGTSIGTYNVGVGAYQIKRGYDLNDHNLIFSGIGQVTSGGIDIGLAVPAARGAIAALRPKLNPAGRLLPTPQPSLKPPSMRAQYDNGARIARIEALQKLIAKGDGGTKLGKATLRAAMTELALLRRGLLDLSEPSVAFLGTVEELIALLEAQGTDLGLYLAPVIRQELASGRLQIVFETAPGAGGRYFSPRLTGESYARIEIDAKTQNMYQQAQTLVHEFRHHVQYSKKGFRDPITFTRTRNSRSFGPGSGNAKS